MYKKIKNIIYLLLKTKIRFDLPKKNKLLLFDEIHYLAFRDIIKKKFNILEIRSKKIYFWIYLKQIFFFDFTFKTYCKNYIKFTTPKVIITFNDARFQMYELKSNFKNIYFISIMNGLRFNYWFKEKKKLWPNKFKGDYFFVLNKYYIAKFQNLIKSDYRILGHFRNNSVIINKNKISKKFLLISVVFNEKKELKFYTKLLKFINLYFSNTNKKIHILLRKSSKDPKLQMEINFYRNIFKSNCEIHQIDEWKKKYEFIDRFENIIFTISTMGFEAISRKKKVAVFTPKSFNGSRINTLWHAPYQRKHNFFSTQNLTFNEVKRVLNNVKNCSQTDWNKRYYNTIKDQFYFNKNNSKLRNLVNKLI